MAATRLTLTSTTLLSWSAMAQRTARATGLFVTLGVLLGEKLAISEFTVVMTNRLTVALMSHLRMVVPVLVILLL